MAIGVRQTILSLAVLTTVFLAYPAAGVTVLDDANPSTSDWWMWTNATDVPGTTVFSDDGDKLTADFGDSTAVSGGDVVGVARNFTSAAIGLGAVMTLSFDVTLQGHPAPSRQIRGMRFGLGDSNGAPAISAGSIQETLKPFDDSYSSGAAGFSINRTGSGAFSQASADEEETRTILDGNFQGANGVPAMVDGTTYSITLTMERTTAATLDISAEYTDGVDVFTMDEQIDRPSDLDAIDTVAVGLAGRGGHGSLEDDNNSNTIPLPDAGFTLDNLLISMEGGVITTPGDYNDDTIVNGDDYTVWRGNYGAGGPFPPESDADGNSDGVVDAADYTVWRDNLPTPTPLAASAAPEPAAWLLFTAAMGFCAGRRRGR